MPREHGESGEFVETTTLDDVRGVFDAVDGPVVLSADVADRLGCTRETARRKLQQLYDRGDLDRRKVARRVIYWRAEDGDESGREPAVTPSSETGDRSDPAPVTDDVTPEDTPESDATGESLDAALARLDTTDDRRDAVRACVEYLREHETGRKSVFLDVVYPEHPARFGSENGWWNKIGKVYLQTVAEEHDPLIPPANEGAHTWRYDPRRA